MSLYIPPGVTGPALEVVERECIAEGCNKVVTSEVWPGARAPLKWCATCKLKMSQRESEHGTYCHE